MLALDARCPSSRRSARVSSLLTLCAAFGLAACGQTPPILDCVAHDDVVPICEFQNPEDLALDASGEWLIVSQAPREDSPGSLVAFRPGDGRHATLWPPAAPDADSDANRDADRARSSAGDAACPGPPSRPEFAPHGIDVSQDGRTLFLVNHGGREAVELFDLGEQAGVPTLAWKGCVPMPEGAMMNDVAALPDAANTADRGHDFVVTQMTNAGLGGALMLVRGKVSGEVFRWSQATGLRPIPSTGGVGPNGVEVSPDGSAVFFSEWVARNLVRVALDGSGRHSVPLGFNPDNLTWMPDGLLLVAGQFATPVEATSCFAVAEGTCGLASAVATVDPETLEVVRLWTHDPATVAGGVSVALAQAGKIWIGTFGGDRIAWFASPSR